MSIITTIKVEKLTDDELENITAKKENEIGNETEQTKIKMEIETPVVPIVKSVPDIKLEAEASHTLIYSDQTSSIDTVKIEPGHDSQSDDSMDIIEEYFSSSSDDAFEPPERTVQIKSHSRIRKTKPNPVERGDSSSSDKAFEPPERSIPIKSQSRIREPKPNPVKRGHNLNNPNEPKGRKKVMGSQARELIAVVYQHMKKEALNGVINVTDARWRTAMAAGVSEKTVTRILKEKKQSDETGEPMKSPHRNKRPRKCLRRSINEDDKEIIKYTIENFRRDFNKPVTLSGLIIALRERIHFNGCVETLRRVLNEIGYEFKTIKS